MKRNDWHGCYSQGWNGEIVSDAFAHPAKYARGLIKRIYQHILDEDWAQPGDVILDPFGGVGLGGLDALANDLNFIGIELEQNFVDMAQGCECTGISPADWVRFYGRWKRAAYLDGRHWCPRCVVEAGNVLGELPEPPVSQAQAKRQMRIFELCLKKKRSVPKYRPLPLPGSEYAPRRDQAEQASFLDQVASPSYERNSGRIPSTTPHHYTGNTELFQRLARNGATATVVQGDSRQLASIVGGAACGVSSPPYAKTLDGGEGPGARYDFKTHSPENAVKQTCAPDYGKGDGQLGAMPEGSHAAVVSSPPYAASLASDDPDRRGGLYRDPKRRGDRTLTAECGNTPGQLGAMSVSSPPYEGQPIANYDSSMGDKWRETGQTPRQRHGGSLPSEQYNIANPDQLGNTTSDDFWSAARQIVQQLALVLRPGAHAVWVLKGFVRNGEYVDFPTQWMELCQACGFEALHWHRAWLIEERGAQYTLDGDIETKRIQRKSFFRLLAERKGSPRIDYEVVLCMIRR